MEQGGQIHVPTGVVRGRLRGGLAQFSTLGQSQSHGWCPGWLARDSGEPVVESKNNNAYVSNPNYVSGSVFLPPHPQPHPPPTGSPVLDSIHTVPSLHQGKSSHLLPESATAGSPSTSAPPSERTPPPSPLCISPVVTPSWGNPAPPPPGSPQSQP